MEEHREEIGHVSLNGGRSIAAEHLSSAACGEKEGCPEGRGATERGIADIKHPTYVVEHLEEEIGEWVRLEYTDMCEVAGADRMIFTKFPFQDFSPISKTHRPVCLPSPLVTLKDRIQWHRVCLLDMKATRLLQPGDSSNFDYFVLGGILGNVPSDDRTSEIRDLGFPGKRHLGEVQMTTNTAVLVCKLILQDKIPFEQISFVDEPDIPMDARGKEVASLPFRYVCEEQVSHVSSLKGTPHLPTGMVEYLRNSADEAL